MSYLSKAERRKQILDVAMKVALDDGLNTLTVRHLAQKAQLSVGLIHYHFKTIQELKCETFMQLIHKNLDTTQVDPHLSLIDKILWALGFTTSEDELPYIRLWNDAEKNSQSSPEFHQVFLIALEEWHKSVKYIFQISNFNHDQESIDDITWQLIGLTLGLERLTTFNAHFFTYEYMTQLVANLIENKKSTKQNP
ncbi:TetR family transcriptional regulator [Acinetobacter sp. B10A]|uniref:TetR family transcriptional regulator n=1 Tax=Acinetobacter baretiae TaxID=2605383 RepID=UPI001B3C5AF9|nr:TetR family transcriptional regulator [Acinetobacter baretiae]MBF7685331.1 TetR family transcriptional regulator [Acinetobacter baretiae]